MFALCFYGCPDLIYRRVFCPWLCHSVHTLTEIALCNQSWRCHATELECDALKTSLRDLSFSQSQLRERAEWFNEGRGGLYDICRSTSASEGSKREEKIHITALLILWRFSSCCLCSVRFSSAGGVLVELSAFEWGCALFPWALVSSSWALPIISL